MKDDSMAQRSNHDHDKAIDLLKEDAKETMIFCSPSLGCTLKAQQISKRPARQKLSLFKF